MPQIPLNCLRLMGESNLGLVKSEKVESRNPGLTAKEIFGMNSFSLKLPGNRALSRSCYYHTETCPNGVFDKNREHLYPRKMLFWKILSFLASFRDFCGISIANPRKYVPAKYDRSYHREN